MSRQTVIITDGDQRAALAVVRSLGTKYRCVVAAPVPGSLAASSRFCARDVVLPDALEHPTEFARQIVDLARTEDAAVVLPIAEPSLLAILPMKSELLPALVPFPDFATFDALSDKQRLLAAASRFGIAVPTQHVIAQRAALPSLDLTALSYPVVLKPARSVGTESGKRAKVNVSYAANADELVRRVSTLSPAAFPLLVQQRIVGPGTGIFVLLWNGEVKAAFAHRRLCEKPASGGVSVYRESIAVDRDLLDRSRVLLESFGWSGVAMVEYKRDSRTGLPYLMEVNGRFWGSLQLAIDAGVDFPKLLVACALGEPVAAPGEYRAGVRSRWWWGQVDHLVGRIHTRRNTVPPGTRSATRALADLVLGPFRKEDYEEVLWWSDPRPFWKETVRWMGAR